MPLLFPRNSKIQFNLQLTPVCVKASKKTSAIKSTPAHVLQDIVTRGSRTTLIVRNTSTERQPSTLTEKPLQKFSVTEVPVAS